MRSSLVLGEKLLGHVTFGLFRNINCNRSVPAWHRTCCLGWRESARCLQSAAGFCVASGYGRFGFHPRASLPSAAASSALEEAQLQIAQLASRNCPVNSRNLLNSTAIRRIPPHPHQSIRLGLPSRSSRRRADASRAASQGILDAIAIASRPSGSRTSCRMCPRPAAVAKRCCPPNRHPLTPSRPGIRLPNSPNWRPSSPSTKGTRAPAPAVATSIVARSPRRSALMSSGHAWLR